MEEEEIVAEAGKNVFLFINDKEKKDSRRKERGEIQ